MATTDTTSALKRRLQAILTGRYTIDRELGQGGMATVFLAQDLRHDRAVAIKLLDPALTSAIGVERFLREIAITARLHHPHILTLIESGQEGGLVYYVMPHIEGESLRDRLSREPRVSVSGAVWIAREIADGLAHAHAHGVIHRDIKPENILVAGGHAWVADFGIARALETSSEATGKALTMTGLPIGTPAYMSPEQVEGRPDVDARSDLYSLGCVLFEMLVGRPPFVARSARAVMNHHVTTPPPSVAELRPDLPPELSALVERAIAKRREERPPSASVFGEELQVIAASAVARRNTPPDAAARAAASGVRRAALAGPATREPGSRSGTFLFAAAAVAAVALAVSTLFPWGGTQSRRPSARPVPGPAAPARPSPGPAYGASIAVMPLATYSADEQSAFLSEGITEEIIAQLARVPGLKVISRTSVLSLASKKLTVPQIAETLGVRHVLEGSVQRAAGHLRVTFQLIDASTDAHIWAESYDRSFRDLLALRQEIAGKVAGALAMAVPGIEHSASSHGIESSPGYEPYLRGSYWLDRTGPAGLERAVEGFEEAIRLDSTFAPAFAGLSNALRQWVTLGYRGDREPYATFARASAMADRALALDSGLAAGYIARALVRINAWAPAASVRADLERALALMPNSGQAHMAYSLGLAREGRYPEALVHGETAVQLDPLSAVMHASLALSALAGGRQDVAIRESRRTQSLEPNFVGGNTIEALAMLGQGRPESCLALDLRRFPEVRALCLQSAGRTGEAARLVDSASAAYRTGAYDKVFQVGLIAAYHALRDDRAGAVEWLGRAYAIAPTGLEFRVLDSGVFEKVRGDPQYRAALLTLHRRVYQRVFR